MGLCEIIQEAEKRGFKIGNTLIVNTAGHKWVVPIGGYVYDKVEDVLSIHISPPVVNTKAWIYRKGEWRDSDITIMINKPPKISLLKYLMDWYKNKKHNR